MSRLRASTFIVLMVAAVAVQAVYGALLPAQAFVATLVVVLCVTFLISPRWPYDPQWVWALLAFAILFLIGLVWWLLSPATLLSKIIIGGFLVWTTVRTIYSERD